MAQVVGEQTAQITQVSQRVDQLAAVVSQLSLNQASQVPVGGSPPRTPYGTPSPPRRQGESSSGLSSLSGFGERPVVPPVRTQDPVSSVLPSPREACMWCEDKSGPSDSDTRS